MSAAGCGGCAGASDGGGYFYASTPWDLFALARSAAAIYQIELGFDPPNASRRAMERRLQRLHAACGCDAAAVAFLVSLAIVSVGPWRTPEAMPRWLFALLSGIVVAAAVKVGVIAAARACILVIARRCSRHAVGERSSRRVERRHEAEP